MRRGPEGMGEASATEPAGPGELESREDAFARFDSALASAISNLRAMDVSDEVARLIADRAERLASALSSTEGSRTAWGYTSGGANARAAGVFVIGLAPFPPPEGGAGIAVAGDGAEGVVVFGDAFEGPAGAVHGGHLAKLLDDVSAIACSVDVPPGAVTRQLDITYHRPAPLRRPLDVRAAVVTAAVREVVVHATIHDGDVLCAEAEATFVAPRPAGDPTGNGPADGIR